MLMAGLQPKIHQYAKLKMRKGGRPLTGRIIKYSSRGSLKSSILIPPLFQEFSQGQKPGNMSRSVFNKSVMERIIARGRNIMFSFQSEATQKIGYSIRTQQRLSALPAKPPIFLLSDSRSMSTRQRRSSCSG
jgi:hypothetical protein